MGEKLLGALERSWGALWLLLGVPEGSWDAFWALLRALGTLLRRSWAFFFRVFDVSEAPFGALLVCSGLLLLALAALTEQLEFKFKISSCICFFLLYWACVCTIKCGTDFELEL